MDQEQKKPVTINPLSTYQSFKKDSCQEKNAARERERREQRQSGAAKWRSDERRTGAAASGGGVRRRGSVARAAAERLGRRHRVEER